MMTKEGTVSDSLRRAGLVIPEPEPIETNAGEWIVWCMVFAVLLGTIWWCVL